MQQCIEVLALIHLHAEKVFHLHFALIRMGSRGAYLLAILLLHSPGLLAKKLVMGGVLSRAHVIRRLQI